MLGYARVRTAIMARLRVASKTQHGFCCQLSKEKRHLRSFSVFSRIIPTIEVIGVTYMSPIWARYRICSSGGSSSCSLEVHLVARRIAPCGNSWMHQPTPTICARQAMDRAGAVLKIVERIHLCMFYDINTSCRKQTRKNMCMCFLLFKNHR